METQITLKENGLVELIEISDTSSIIDRGTVTGYWKSEGTGTAQQLKPTFYLPAGGPVAVTTKVSGSLQVHLTFFNRSAHHGGPTMPQEGGTVSLVPGQWEISFSGWISLLKKSSIEVSVQYTDHGSLEISAAPQEEGKVEVDGATFSARGKGSSRPQAIRVAYRRADEHAAGQSYTVLNERVFAEANAWVCILTCELL